MYRYKIKEQIASGSYGLVYSALNLDNNRQVAIKIMENTYQNWEQALNEPDIKILTNLPKHPNLITLLDKFYYEQKLYLVFDLFSTSLLTFIQANKLNFYQHRNIAFKLLQGLSHLHANSLMHRDLKPENILVKCPNAESPLKDAFLATAKVAICDFGLTKNQRQKPHTDYISTRWYRAPEQLLGFSEYDTKIDVFAAGCVLAEMCSQKALFQGVKQVDQIIKICEILGVPEPIGSPKLKAICDRLGSLGLVKFERFTRSYASQNIMLMVGCNEKLGDLLCGMLRWDPIERFSVVQCLQHSYFQVD
ncbi:Kinase, CMGC RCK [Spironucleus salmonicida]|uniref:Kinase, CMGC RCK n=1 Tax=Spironucleus salmonicida TaxID=348837 RepID=V6LL10_9EUKA|nr:Kinase, CMGC RCK [Spironucleus salmonicida]|eukprot:EST45237.1 Kinase, CMGC RCK [Spironucleus salmonicida]